jgi:peroxiredoxin
VSALLLSARLVLALVFALGGLAKLRDRRGARQALVDFGLPARLAAPVGILLPLVELAVAAALIARSTAARGAIAALSLLVVFAIAIVRVLREGRRPDCHCFGQLHSHPAGWGSVVRNLALAGLAAVIAVAGWVDPGASTLGWLGGLSNGMLAAIAVASCIVVGQAWFSWQLLRQQGRLLLRIEQLEAARVAPALGPGSSAPDFVLAGADGDPRTLAQLRERGRLLMLLFSDAACGPCRALLPEVARWQLEHNPVLRLVVVSRPDGASRSEPSEQLHPVEVLVDEHGSVRELYGVRGVPAAVLVGSDGRIAVPVAVGADAIRALVDAAIGAPVANAAPTAQVRELLQTGA